MVYHSLKVRMPLVMSKIGFGDQFSMPIGPKNSTLQFVLLVYLLFKLSKTRVVLFRDLRLFFYCK